MLTRVCGVGLLMIGMLCALAAPAQAQHEASPAAPTGTMNPPANMVVKAQPDEIDLGEIPTMDTKGGMLRLVNTDTKPHVVHAVRPSCGCTTAKFDPDTEIAPGASLDIEVKLSGGIMAGPLLHKTITVSVEGQPDFVVPIRATAVSYVVVEPTVLDPDVQPDGKFKLKSIDGEPFRVMTMQPVAIEGLPTEAKAVHELTLNWDRVREANMTKRVTFYLDHPKCQQTSAFVNLPITPPPSNGQTPPVATAGEIDNSRVLENMIREGKTTELMERIKAGLDVNEKDLQGVPLIILAARYGQTATLAALLKQGANVEITDKSGRTPLMVAAQVHKPEMIRALLDGKASVKAADKAGNTALCWAAGQGDAETVKMLIDAGSDVNVVGATGGWTPLIWAAAFGQTESIQHLLKAGAKLEAADKLQGATALIHAARNGRLENLVALIKAGAKLEARDKSGMTALLAAAASPSGTAEKIKALLDAGADLHAQDNQHRNALQLANTREDKLADAVVTVLGSGLSAEPAGNAAGASAVQHEKPAEAPAGHSH